MPMPPSQFRSAAEVESGASPSGKKISLGTRIVLRFSLGLIVASAFLFLPAGTLKFWQGWAYIAILFIPGVWVYGYFWKRDPEMLERRMQNKEEVSEQKLLIRCSAPLFIAVFLLPGFDERFGWSRGWMGDEPLWLTLFSETMVLGAFLFVVWVVSVNRFAARTIRVEAGQTVISSGPYRIVRHPLYMGSGVLWLFTPLALGSRVSLPAFALLLPFYAIRLLNEEKVLREELPGYREYCLRTRYRLIPLVW
ncbi:MAG: isoprenylcysteine carboxylmethyltransferase family protein [Terracidiphilus sp.]|jgi:protein-S-isoprenylcysteine O-methyltransferase Ste14